MEPKKAITTGLRRSAGGCGVKAAGGKKKKKKCSRKMAKRITRKTGRNGGESEMGERGKR